MLQFSGVLSSETRPFRRLEGIVSADSIPSTGIYNQGLTTRGLSLRSIRPSDLKHARQAIKNETLFLNLSQYKIFHDFMHMRAKTICEKTGGRPWPPG